MGIRELIEQSIGIISNHVKHFLERKLINSEFLTE